jgi:hypothetical protein
MNIVKMAIIEFTDTENIGPNASYSYFICLVRRDCYNATDKIFEEPPNSAKRVGMARRAGGKGKGKASAKGEEPDKPAHFPTFPPVSRSAQSLSSTSRTYR